MATLEQRVATLETLVAALQQATGVASQSQSQGASTSSSSDAPSSLSSDFYFDAPGRWLDVTIGAGQVSSRNFVPTSPYSGQIEIYAGRLSGNLTDRIKVTVYGTGGSVPYQDTGWMNLDGYNARVNITGPVTIAVQSELYGHISLGCQHQP